MSSRITKVFDFFGTETGRCQIVIIEIEVEQQVFQLDLIPFSCDFVQRNIERLLIILVQIDHDDLRLGVSEVLHNVVALVASDDGSVLVYDDRIHVSEGFNAAFDVLIFWIGWLQLDSWVVFRRRKLARFRVSIFISVVIRSASNLL